MDQVDFKKWEKVNLTKWCFLLKPFYFSAREGCDTSSQSVRCFGDTLFKINGIS